MPDCKILCKVDSRFIVSFCYLPFLKLRNFPSSRGVLAEAISLLLFTLLFCILQAYERTRILSFTCYLLPATCYLLPSCYFTSTMFLFTLLHLFCSCIFLAHGSWLKAHGSRRAKPMLSRSNASSTST